MKMKEADIEIIDLEHDLEEDKVNEGYDDGGAKVLLAQAYEKTDEQDKANLIYQEILEKYEGTDAAKTAKKALKAQNRKKKNN